MVISMLSNKEVKERCEFCAFVQHKEGCKYFCETYDEPCNEVHHCQYDEENNECKR